MTRISEKIINILLIGSIVFMIFILLVLIITDRKSVVVEKQKIVSENIVFFGDSITEQYDLNNYYTNYVVNSGVGGDTTENFLNRIYPSVYQYNPSTVFLLIGINDFKADKTPDEIIDEIISNIEDIIIGIQENREMATIYVESIYPINKGMFNDFLANEFKNADNVYIQKVNRELKVLCEEYDITYIDMYKELADENNNLKTEYSKDGLHLNDFGYEKVTSILNKYINSN